MKTAVPFLVSFVCLVSGCIGFMDRTDRKTPIQYVYQPTCECAEMIVIPFKDGSGMSAEGRIARALCTLILPLTIVDFPLEVVFDTIALPLDMWNLNKKRSNPEADEAEKIVSE